MARLIVWVIIPVLGGNGVVRGYIVCPPIFDRSKNIIFKAFLTNFGHFPTKNIIFKAFVTQDQMDCFRRTPYDFYANFCVLIIFDIKSEHNLTRVDLWSLKLNQFIVYCVLSFVGFLQINPESWRYVNQCVNCQSMCLLHIQESQK